MDNDKSWISCYECYVYLKLLRKHPEDLIWGDTLKVIFLTVIRLVQHLKLMVGCPWLSKIGLWQLNLHLVKWNYNRLHKEGNWGKFLDAITVGCWKHNHYDNLYHCPVIRHTVCAVLCLVVVRYRLSSPILKGCFLLLGQSYDCPNAP